MRYGISQKPFNNIKYVITNMLKDFSQVECLRKEQKDFIKIWSMEDVFAILPPALGKSLERFERSKLFNSFHK